MSRIGIRIVVLLLAATAAAISGCGGGSKATSASTSASRSTAPASSHTTVASNKPLSRAEFIERGDAICYRLNARRKSTSFSNPAGYKRVMPPLAAYEMEGVNEMDQLVPPSSLASTWRQIVIDSRTVAEVTRLVPTFKKGTSDALGKKYDIILGKAIYRMVHAAQRVGFKECSRFL